MTHKAGGDAPDAELATWWAGVRGKRDRVLLGAYWVLLPGNPTGRASAFLARLDAQCPDWRTGPFILQADCEKWNGDGNTVPSVSEINAFCDELTRQCPALNPVVYAPKWVYGDKVSALRYPLWASAYVTAAGAFQKIYPGDNAAQWGTYGGRSPDILQYTSSAVIGGQSTCDANAYRGTLQQLTALVAPGWSAPDMELTDKIVDGNGKSYGTVNGALITLLQRSDSATNQQLPALSTAVAKVQDAVTSAPTTLDPTAVASELIKAGVTLEIAQALVSLLSAAPAT